MPPETPDLPDTETRPEPPAEARPRPSGGAWVMVLEGDTTALHPLDDDGVAVVGRGPEAEIPLRDTGASRAHARIVTAAGEAAVVDLASRNGTWVNGERVEGTRVLAPGDVVAIGAAHLVLGGSRARPRRSVLEAAAFRARLDDEVERALSFERPLALLAVSLGADADPRAAAHAVDASLRRVDVAGWGPEGWLLATLPERDLDEAAEVAERLLSDLGPSAPSARAGLAACPAHGCDAASLLAAARAAAGAAVALGVAPAEEGAARLEVGDQTVLVADPAMAEIYRLIRRVAASDLAVPVLITGETGVGKENAAAAVHRWSPRRDGPFVTLNCAAIQESLVESELFGHEKGAFTGAVAARAGLLESAAGGTVFLDEVGELPPATQAKLLRALESRRVTRVGGVREVALDIRVVAATNRDLEAESRAGRFRLDLFHRLAVATVFVPPLRERPREVPLLARAFLDAACARARRPAMAIAPAALQAIARYDWPGNVRELKNAMEYAAAAVADPVLELYHLPGRVRAAAGVVSQAPAPSSAPPPPSQPPPGFRPVADELRELERRRMAEALDAAGGVQNRAAQLIAMPLRTFAGKVKLYGLAPKGARVPR